MNFKSVVLLGFIISFIFAFMNLFLYFQAEKNYNAISPGMEEASATVYGEDIIITFFSNKTLYHPGERLDFYIDVFNGGEEFISRVDFSIKVRYYYPFNIEVFSKDHYSDRGFESNKVERIKVGERVGMGETLPGITPSGIYVLEFVASPENGDSLPPASVMIYVKQSPTLLFLPIFGMLIFGVFYALSLNIVVRYLVKTSEAIQRTNVQFSNGLVRKFLNGLVLYLIRISEAIQSSIDKTSFHLNKFNKTVSNFSIGQKFVFGGICLLSLTAVILSIGLSDLANKMAILAYYSLILGVFNNIWEYISESRASVRMPLSLVVFSLLIHLSSSEMGSPIAHTSVGLLITLSFFMALQDKEGWSAKRIRAGKHSSLIAFSILTFWLLLIVQYKIISFYLVGVVAGFIVASKILGPTSSSQSVKSK